MNTKFWKGKRVFITGHTGFKGGWITLWLVSRGVRVVGFSLQPPSEPSLFELANVAKGITSIHGDIRDLDHLSSLLDEHRPEIVIHMAAQPIVRRSYAEPIETYSTNVMGTVNVLEAVRRCDSVRVMVNVTSDKCYENREWCWGYRECDTMGGHDPYSSSKGCAELITSAYRRSFFQEHGGADSTHVATARAGNVIGGGDWGADRLVPDIMDAFIAGRPVVIRSPHSIRPWQHVLEPLNGYLTVAEKLWKEGREFAGAWNFGPHEEGAKSASWVVDHIAELWGRNASWEIDQKPKLHEATHLKLDCSKAKSMLGWKPKLGLETALKWTVEWYNAYSQNQDMRLITEQQISRYETWEER